MTLVFRDYPRLKRVDWDLEGKTGNNFFFKKEFVGCF
jgi:hypothetical protein